MTCGPRATALLSVGVAHKNIGQFIGAIPLLEEADILADEIQAISVQADALGGQAECWFRQDRWDAVVELDERLLGLHSRYGISRGGSYMFRHRVQHQRQCLTRRCGSGAGIEGRGLSDHDCCWRWLRGRFGSETNIIEFPNPLLAEGRVRPGQTTMSNTG